MDKYEPVNLVEKARAFLSCKKVEEESEEESRQQTEQPTPGTLLSSSPLRDNEKTRKIPESGLDKPSLDFPQLRDNYEIIPAPAPKKKK